MAGNKVNVYSRAVELKSLNSKAQSLLKDIQLQDFTIAQHYALVKYYEIKTDILEIKTKKEKDGELMLTSAEKLKLSSDICRLAQKQENNYKRSSNSSKKRVELLEKYITVQSEMGIKIIEIKKEDPVAVAKLTIKERLFIKEALSTAEKIFRKYKQNSKSKLQLELDRYQKKLQQKGL